MNKLNVWRKRITNQPKFRLNGLKTITRRAAAGWSWKLMCESELVASGTAKTDRECREAVRAAKVQRLGKLTAPSPRPATRPDAVPTLPAGESEATNLVTSPKRYCHAPEDGATGVK